MTRQGILIAGGYGVVGQRIAADLAPDYQVIVAGRHLEQVKATAATIGHGVRGREIDAAGADRPARAFSDPRVIEFPSPFGPRPAYLFPFSDQVLYPRTMGAKTALTRLAIEPTRLARLLAASVRVGAARLVARERLRHALARRRPDRAPREHTRFALRVDVIHDGRSAALIEKWGVEPKAEPQSKESHQRRANGAVRMRRRS